MGAYIARRVLALIPLLIIVSFIVFSLSQLLPGDPARVIAGGQKATPEGSANAREDLGTSFFDHETVAQSIAQRFPVTLSLALGALVLTVLIGLPLGILAAVRQGSFVDRMVTASSSVALAMPDFWLGMILLLIFAVNLQVLPSRGYIPLTD